MSRLKTALTLAKKGFHIFPVKGNSKLPAIKGYPELATRDEKVIEDWFKKFGDPNIGISTSRFGDDEALLVVDIDNKGEKKGDDEIKKLESKGKVFPETFEQRTPTGGRHLIYRVKEAIRQGVDKLGPGLDTRSSGGYIVGAGSRTDLGKYTGHVRDIARAPDWLVSSSFLRKRPKAETNKKIEGVDPEKAKARAAEYLKNHAPQSIKGQGGDQTAYKVAARLKDFGLSKEATLELMLSELWHNGCGWTPEKLQKKVEHAYQYGLDPQGAAAPQAFFDEVVTEEEKFFLDKINSEYALVYVEGGHFILHETVEEWGQKKRVFLTEATFRRRFSPKKVHLDGSRPRSQADIWLDWKGRREFAGLCFAPEREPRHNYYNLWRGFSVVPIDPKDATEDQHRGLSMFLEHALENVCGGDEKLFKWLMGYFAHLVQKPFERPLTTIVFKGLKGTGKNVLLDRVGALLGKGNHYLVAQDSRYLTSNFNGHLDSCLMLVLDEAFWSGDKGADSKLKGLTTSPTIFIERKGKEPYTVDNLVRVAIIGNEDWLVPATADERRYAVFQLGNKRRQDRAFFKTMRLLLDEKGGSGLLLHYLQNFDLSAVDVDDAPKTKALLDQKLRSGDPLFDWWFECLQEGKFSHSDFDDEWVEKIPKDAFRRAFKEYCKSRAITGRILASNSFGSRLGQFCPSMKTGKIQNGNKRSNVYVFPPLAEARHEWEKFIGHEVNWDE
jgi:hypothetical protein